MSKLYDNARKSKLNQDSKNHTEPIIQNIVHKDYPKCYRFDADTVNTLQNTLLRINERTPKKIGETKLIKALIALSTTIKDEDIIEAIKSAW